MVELEKQLDELTSIITRLILMLKQKNVNGDFYVNSLCEDIFIIAFNKIFDADFKNLNVGEPNAPAVDLIDRNKKLLIQVTSDDSPTKLYSTLGKWKSHIDHYVDCKTLYHFIIGEKKTVTQKTVDKHLHGSSLAFNIHEHIIDVFAVINLLRQQYSKGLSMGDLVEVKERLEQSVDGLAFKYKKLSTQDRPSFSNTAHSSIQLGLMLDRIATNKETGYENKVQALFDDGSIHYIQLVSNAGFGKSFALNHYFEYLFDAAIADFNNITPLIVNFKDIISVGNIESQLIKDFHKRKFPLLILDGLDEIGDEPKQKIIEENLYSYLIAHRNVRCLISSRYELKSIGNDGLNDIKFTKHELKKLTDDQVASYLQEKKIYAEITSDPAYSKINTILQIPFNLYHVAEYYAKNRKLENSITVILHKRINEDLGKNCDDKMSVLKARLFLEKLAVINNLAEDKNFSLRDIGKAIGFDSSVFEIINNSKLLHFDEAGETMHFTNNSKYTEDLLAATYFTDKDWEEFIEFFQVDNKEVNIPQAWYNPISMLLISKGLDSDFSRKIIENYPFVLVNAEDFGLADRDRSKIFEKIFETYEQKDIWIDRAMYEEERLSKFGDTDESFAYLIDKISSSINLRTKIKAISLLRSYKASQIRAAVIYDELKKVIIANSGYGYLVSQAYHCLAGHSMHLSKEQHRNITDLSVKTEDLFLHNNQYVRSAVYRFITATKLQNEYQEYLLEGLRLLDKFSEDQVQGRDEVSLMDEGVYLDYAFYEIEDLPTLLKVAEALIGSFQQYERYHATSILEKMIEKLADLVNKRKNKKRLVAKLVRILSKCNDRKEPQLKWYYWQETVLNFKLDEFVKSVLEAEKEFLSELFVRDVSFFKNFNFICNVVAKLLTEKSYPVLSNAIDSGSIKIEEAVYLHSLLNEEQKIVKTDLHKKLLSLKATFPKSRKSSTEEDYLQFQKRNFDLLFDSDLLKDEILMFFSKSDIIKSEPLGDVEWYDGDFYYRDPRIEFLRNHMGFVFSKTLTKYEVMEFFDRTELKEVLIKEIFDRLIKSNFDLTTEQSAVLKSVLYEKISKINFRTAIYNVKSNSFSIDGEARNTFKLAQLLGLKFDKETNLDLLSYDSLEWVNTDAVLFYEKYFNLLVENIDDIDAVKSRVCQNLVSGINHLPVLNNHIIFSARHNLKDNFPSIEKNIQNSLEHLQQEHLHHNPILVYFTETKNYDFLISMLPDEMSPFSWQAIDLLISENKYQKEITAILNRFYDLEKDHEKKLKIANKLIMNNSNGALERFVAPLEKIMESGKTINFSFHEFAAGRYRLVEIGPAIKILEMSYIYKFDSFHNPRSVILNYFRNLIESDKEMFQIIWAAAENLIQEKKHVIENIQFLEPELQSLKSAYYSYYKSNRTFKEAIEIVNKFE